MNILVPKLSKLFRLQAGRRVDPVPLMLTDINARGRRTDVGRAFRALWQFGIKVASPGPIWLNQLLMKAMSFDAYDPNFPNYENLYLSGAESKRLGPQVKILVSFEGNT